MSIRRILMFYVSMILGIRAGYQLAYEPDLRDRLAESPWQSIALLLVVLVTIAFVLWSIVRPNQWRTAVTFVLGIVSALWTQDLLEGISWGQLGLVAIILVAINALMYITTWDYIFGSATTRSRLASRLAPPMTRPAPPAP